jgi:uncharacterized protein (UPF0332 family)
MKNESMEYVVFAKKSHESLSVAQYCFDNGYYNSCVNRAYYAMLQIAVAVLFKAGITTTTKRITHEWVQSEFARTFVWQQKRFPQFKGFLDEVQETRNIADYSTQAINRKKARRVLDKAVLFVELIAKEVHYAA